jgi:hypothetical protein
MPRHRVIVGTIVAAFFVAIFLGNIAQWTEGADPRLVSRRRRTRR